MTDEQINEEFEKSLLSGLNLKDNQSLKSMRELPIEKKKVLLINLRKVELIFI